MRYPEYHVDADIPTIYRIDDHGEMWDLNADGAPLRGARDFEDFARTLCRQQGAFDSETLSEILALYRDQK